MKSIKPWMAAGLILLSQQIIAQEKSDRLFIGDKVPDIEFNGLHNYPTTSAKLSDFKGKAVVLDFWNKGCSSCIAYFPKMQKLQQEFKDDLIILLVNDQPSQTLESLKPLFKTSTNLRENTLPMVLGDPFYSNNGGLFPHYGVPYHVWIDKNGIIKATTRGEEATRDNIQKLIRGEQLDVIKVVHAVGDVRDEKTSWLSYENGLFIDKLLFYKSADFTYKNNDEHTDLSPLRKLKLGEQYHSMLMKEPHAGNKTGGVSGTLNNIEGKQIGFYIRSSMVDLYKHAFLAGSGPVIVEGLETKISKDHFLYEYTNPNYSYASGHQAFQEDLENYFGYSAKEEMRPMDCYILYRTEQALKLSSRGGPEIFESTGPERETVNIRNYTIGVLKNALVGAYHEKKGSFPLVFDETGIDKDKKIDITFHGNFDNIPAMNLSLSKYGLAVRKESREVPVLVIRKVK